MSFKDFYEDKDFTRFEEDARSDTNPIIRLAWDVRTSRTTDILLRLIRSFRNPPTIVDIGCAGIWLHDSLSDRNVSYKYVGLDLSFNYLQLSKDTPNSCRVLGDASSLPFRDSCIEIASSFEIIEHLQKPELAAEELLRCCRSYIIVSVPLIGISLFGFDRRFEKYNKRKEKKIQELIERVGWDKALRILYKQTGAAHVNFFTKTRFVNMFSDTRFAKWRVRGMLFFIPGLEIIIRNSALEGVYRFFERILFSRLHIFITSTRHLPIGAFGNQYGILVMQRTS